MFPFNTYVCYDLCSNDNVRIRLLVESYYDMKLILKYAHWTN